MRNWQYSIILIIFLSSCIGEDIIDDRVEPEVRIINIIESIEVGTSYQFEANFLNNVGQVEDIDIFWSSSDEDIITINNQGLASALSPGMVEIKASATTDSGQFDMSFQIDAGQETVVGNSVTMKSGTIRTTSSYKLQGEFTIEETNSGLKLSIGENYEASTSLPGLYLYLSNNPNSTSNALEIAAVEIFSGAHTYEINNTAISDYSYLLYYCKPFNVKVGDGKFEE